MQLKQLIKLIQKLKPGVIYDGNLKGFRFLLHPELFHNKMNKLMQSYLERYGIDANNKYFLPNPVMRDAYKGKRSFISDHKNLLKEYLESSLYRKKLRKAGIPENQIQERINGLHDTLVRIDKANTLGNLNGMSFTPGELVIFNPNKLYIDRGELIQHELAHLVDLTHTANSTSLLKTGMSYKDMYNKNSNMPLLKNQNLRWLYNEKALNDVKNKYLDMSKSDDPNWDKTYFLTPAEMIAKILPLQINAWKNNWSPKLQVRFLPDTYDVRRMNLLIGEKGILELMERLLKKGGKITYK